jgi:hypothetical protein
MRLFNFKQSTFSFYKRIDLLDGQRRGEVLFRRFFVLFFIYLVGYFLITIYAPEAETNQEVVEVVKKEVVQEVEASESCELEIPEVEEVVDPELEAIRKFTQVYGGSRIDAEYFVLLENACETTEGLRTVVAISVAESGMGRDLPSRVSNFWGWFKGGDKNYDPSREVMASDICTGIETHYMGIGTDIAKATRYVGYYSADWIYNFTWAYAQMEVK